MPATMKEVLDAYEAERRYGESAGLRFPPRVGRNCSPSSGASDRAAGMAWGFLFDIIHHRGQITTYLRPMGSTVPQVYGPTADEP